MEILDQKQKIILIIIIVVIAIVIGYYYYNSTKEIYSYNYAEIENVVEEEVVEEIEEKEEEEIIIHITGAIINNGIVKVNANARINDVIEAAGGLTEDADLTNVNLAYEVKDGQKIYIPSIDDEIEEIDTIVSEGGGIAIIDEEIEEEESLIDINHASLAELMTIPGIGESTATKIIEYRETQGAFETIEEIKNVSGIGDAKYNTIKEYITV